MKIISILMVVGLLLGSHTIDSIDIKTKKVPNIEISSEDPSLTKSQGLMMYQGAPFSGKVAEYHHQNVLIAMKEFLDGKPHGVHTTYHPNGCVKEIRTYLDGEKHGLHRGFYASGIHSFEYNFVEGFSEGNHKEWFEDGSIYADMNYRNGKEFGPQKIWREDGKLRANYVVRENGRRYGLQGIKRCTKLDGKTKTIDPYENQ